MTGNGDRFIAAADPDAPGAADGVPGPGRMILVQGFEEELKRPPPSN